MGIREPDMFSGLNKVETAIARLRNFEPPEGYYLAFSGGKDSVTLLALAKEAGVKFDAHYNITTIDPPELVQFIKTFPDVIMERPESTFYALLQKRGLPRRQGRWCCKELKERGGSGRIVLTGVRWQESPRRRNRHMVETCYNDTTKRFVHPIIDWTGGMTKRGKKVGEVWDYIMDREIKYCGLYDEGFARLGCVLCPMVRDIDRQKERFPKTVQAIRNASDRLWERHTRGTERFESPDTMFEWWLDRDATVDNNKDQTMMFDSNGVE